LVRHNQQLGRTTLQTVNLRHPCVQCRWSSLLECLTGLFKVGRSFVRCFLNTTLKHFYFVDTDTYYGSALETLVHYTYVYWTELTELNWTASLMATFMPLSYRSTLSLHIVWKDMHFIYFTKWSQTFVCFSEPQGMSYIETSNLDGETNLKIRQVLFYNQYSMSIL